METALYFPRLRVPENSWFTQILLYWDKAATVIPSQLDNRQAELGSYMSELVKADLLREIEPYFAQMSNSEVFDSNFVAMLDTSTLPTIEKSGQWGRIHQEKASPQLFVDMKTRGLARPDPEHRYWWQVEKQTANLYLAYLIGSVCRWVEEENKEDQLIPVTDQNDILISLAQPADDTRSRLNALVSVVIRDCLPVPSQTIPVNELADFKDKYRDQLTSLHIRLKYKLADLVLMDDTTAREAKLAGVKQDIKDEVRHLSSEMSKRRWPVILVGVAALASPPLGAAAAVAAGGTALAIGLGITGGVVGAAGALPGLRHPARFDEKAPLAFAALAASLKPPRHFRLWPFHHFRIWPFHR